LIFALYVNGILSIVLDGGLRGEAARGLSVLKQRSRSAFDFAFAVAVAFEFPGKIEMDECLPFMANGAATNNTAFCVVQQSLFLISIFPGFDFSAVKVETGG